MESLKLYEAFQRASEFLTQTLFQIELLLDGTLGINKLADKKNFPEKLP